MPSNPADTYGLLRAAIPGPQPGGLRREPPPVRPQGPQAPGRPPHPARQGEGDPRGHRHHPGLLVADGPGRPGRPPKLPRDEGIGVEVIDLRTIAPLDQRDRPRLPRQDQPPGHPSARGPHGTSARRRRTLRDGRRRGLLAPGHLGHPRGPYHRPSRRRTHPR
ncbi:hypothetical protein ACRAWF_23140 [Streptomyces sp. L7]